MAYAEIPRDVTKIKRKVIAGLTKRQLVCFLIAAAIGVPLYFLLRVPLGSTPAAYIMMFTMMPAMLFAFYEKNGLPLEQYLRYMFQVMFFRAKERPYRTDNIYDRLYYDILLKKEVEEIVERAKQESSSSESKTGKQNRGKQSAKEERRQSPQAKAKPSAPGRKASTKRKKSRPDGEGKSGDLP